ncbi:hypothetical protein EON64_03575 [archaeon]|nr:MAG: hypothetical protein EON64_03575 [archaeon]
MYSAENGVENETDSQWNTTYNDVYKSVGLQVPWYVILGNHDYHKNPAAQISYSKHHRDRRWTMPDHVYNAIYPIPNSNHHIEIVFIDTTRIATNETAETRPQGIHSVSAAEVQQELQRIEGYLSRSSARWLLVAGHYTIYSLAEHGDNHELIPQLVPILRRYHVQAYLNGHDHSLQHISWQGVEYFTSGHGCLTDNYPEGHWEYNRSSIAVAGFKFGVIAPGFGTAVVSEDTLHVQYISQDGDILYTTVLTNPRSDSDLEQILLSQDSTASYTIQVISGVLLGLVVGCIAGYLAFLSTAHKLVKGLVSGRSDQGGAQPRNEMVSSANNKLHEYKAVTSSIDEEEQVAL